MADQKSVRAPLVEQLDELQRISGDERKQKLGEQWAEDVTKFYTLLGYEDNNPSFRPRVSIPQLQTLMLNEATDLTDNNPRILITDRKTKKRDSAHEDAYMAHWNQQFWSNQILLASLWGLLANIGYIQIGHDPFANHGQGQVWARCRDPRTVFPDPFSLRDDDLAYVMFEDKMYLDEVRRRWPETGFQVRPSVAVRVPSESEPAFGFQMPPGAMSCIPGLPSKSMPSGDGRVRVRWLFCRDASIEEMKASDVNQALVGVLPTVKNRPKYPHGRIIIECEGTILADGQNPTPLGMFPLVSFTGMPRLTSYFPPSARSYGQPLQDLAERFITQIYENAVRTNNGIILISDQAGINVDNFGGTPAEIHVVNGQLEKAVQVINPANNVFNAQLMEMPKFLFDMMKMVEGFTPARLGEPTQGNVAKDLYGMSIFESQKLTRMRGRLMAESVQRLGEISFYSMAKFYTCSQVFPIFTEDSSKFLADWNPIGADQLDNFDVAIDPASIRPVSQTAMKSLAIPLAQMGALPNRELLHAVEWPQADAVSQEVQTQQSLAALAGLTGKKK